MVRVMATATVATADMVDMESKSDVKGVCATCIEMVKEAGLNI